MTFSVVDICKPTHTFDTDKFAARFVYTPPGSIQRVLLRYFKLTVAAVDCNTKPHFISHYQRKCLWVGNGVYISYNDKLLVCLGYPCKEIAEKRERRIGNYYIGLITQSSNLGAFEITIAIEIIPMQVFDVYMAVACNITVKNENLAVCLGFVGVELRR